MRFLHAGFRHVVFAMFHGAASADRAGIEDALAGNLCWCTGYGLIIDAAARVRDLAASGPASTLANRLPRNL